MYLRRTDGKSSRLFMPKQKGVWYMLSTSRGILMAGNWKMYKTRPETEAFIAALQTEFPRMDKLTSMLCVGYTLLATVQDAAKRCNLPIMVAAQNMESHEDGAYTGEVSPMQLTDVGTQAVVLGHSERRSYYNETDATVNAKTLKALSHDLMAVVCVGETLEQRESNKTDEVVTYQVSEALKGVQESQVNKVVVAYEPVWAIGTGKVCEAVEANRVCAVIRDEIRRCLGDAFADEVRILYGGSMKPDNAPELLAQSDIDGGLIGGASLTPDSYLALLKIAARQLDIISAATVTA
jgi:triosephosphate isomerase (TIM)